MARVLLVEDEPDIARIITFKLEREGHEVRVDDAFGFAPDLAIVDAGVDADLQDVVDRLRQRCAVVVLVDARDERTPAGVAATVRKPFKPTVLARLVREITAGRNHST